MFLFLITPTTQNLPLKRTSKSLCFWSVLCFYLPKMYSYIICCISVAISLFPLTPHVTFLTVRKQLFQAVQIGILSLLEFAEKIPIFEKRCGKPLKKSYKLQVTNTVQTCPSKRSSSVGNSPRGENRLTTNNLRAISMELDSQGAQLLLAVSLRWSHSANKLPLFCLMSQQTLGIEGQAKTTVPLSLSRPSHPESLYACVVFSFLLPLFSLWPFRRLLFKSLRFSLVQQ